jgi:hypothetical protein
MSRRPLPTAAEAAAILARRRTRPPRRPAAKIGRSLTPFLKAWEAKFGADASGLEARWREIVGETLGRLSQPTKLSRSRKDDGASLEIRVDGPAATLVQHQAEDILARVNLVLGEGAVARLRIVQGPLRSVASKARNPAAPRLAKGPLDAAAEAELGEGLAALPEGGLKRALLTLGRGVVRRGGGN